MIRWFANNSIAANFLMVGILLAGFYTAFFRIPLEVTPSKSYNGIRIAMPYRGATAKDVERDILIPIENSLEGVEGIKMLHADGSRGYGQIWIEAKDGYDPKELLDVVEARVDAITSFPSETERPRIHVPDSSEWMEVLTVAVTARLPADDLRRLARRVQEDLLEIPGISRVNLEGTRNHEIAIEAGIDRLEAYDLGFRELAEAIRRSSVDLPAGAIRSESGTLVVRTRGQAYTTEDFEAIPVRAASGAEVLLGEIATVKDGFEEGDKRVAFNGQPAIFLEVMRAGNESAIDISKKVAAYVDAAPTRFPEGIALFIWDDESIRIRGRLSTLAWSLVQGGLLVFAILGLFLRPRLAFWVMMGIPVSFAGGVLLMPTFGLTANLTSLFGFMLVLGLVVDDAIVTGENIYSRARDGLDPLEASVRGTKEVAVPVTFGALTTVVAFLPLLYFEGWWGDFAKQIPPVVAPVLLFSLIESKLILPSHLKHLKVRRTQLNAFDRFQKRFASSLEWFVANVYQPSLRIAVRYRTAVLAGFVAAGLLIAGYCKGGRMGFISLPEVDRPRVSAWLDLPDDTPTETTHAYVDRIAAAIEGLKSEFVDPGTGESLIVNIMKVGCAYYAGADFDNSRGMVAVELMPPSLRTGRGARNSEIVKRWNDVVGKIPEANSFVIRSESMGGKPRRGDYMEEALELEIRGVASEEKNAIAERVADLIESKEGIRTAWARVNHGQDELEFRLKPRALELGLTQRQLAQQIRQAFYGEEAQRLLRDSSEIRVMVRLPREARESLDTLDRIRVRTPGGAEVPLATVADVAFVKAPSFVERNDRAEVVRIGAMPEDETVDIVGIAKAAVPEIQEIVSEGKGLSFVFRGYVAEYDESRRRTIIGFVALLFALYALLAIPFKSLLQPLYVLVAVPFGIIGALLGHMAMGITPSYLSVFGMLAVSGIVVNDALVLVDYINRRRKAGVSLHDAVLEAGGRRFRPIVLTSLTTFVGLVPLLLDRSLQAQFLIPMATTLGSGILVATGITLYLIPCTLIVAEDIGRGWRRVADWYCRPFRRSVDDLSKPASHAGEGVAR